MNEVHWHLALNHLPIIFPLVGLLLLLGGFFLKSEILKRAAYGIFILAAVSTIVAFSTGEAAEDIVERIPGIDENYIEIHEEVAEIFSLLMYILGGLSLIGLWANWKKLILSKLMSMVILVVTLIALFFGMRSGTTGGEIRHAEIRKNGTLTAPANEQQGKVYKRDDDHDDD